MRRLIVAVIVLAGLGLASRLPPIHAQQAQTPSDLSSVALAPSDLGDFYVDSEDPTPQPGYAASFTRTLVANDAQVTGNERVTVTLLSVAANQSLSAARAQVTDGTLLTTDYGAEGGFQPGAPLGVGDVDLSASWQHVNDDGTVLQVYADAFVRGRIITIVLVGADPSVADPSVDLADAQLQDGKLQQAAQPQQPPVTTPSAVPQASPNPVPTAAPPATASPASATTGSSLGFQTITSPAGFQYAVPANWQAFAEPPSSDVDSRAETSPDLKQLVFVDLARNVPPSLSPGQFVGGLLVPMDGDGAYKVTMSPTSANVAGADAASTGAASFVDSRGIPTLKFVTAAQKGNVAFILIIYVTKDYNLQSPNTVPQILASFQLMGSAPAATTLLPTATSSAHVLQASGSGNNDTAIFTLTTAGAMVCAQVSGTDSTGTFGPTFIFDFRRSDGTIDSFPDEEDSGGCKIVHPDDGPGSYYLHVIATPWTNWSITVDAQ